MKDVEGDVVLYKPTVTSWQVVSTEQLPNTSTAVYQALWADSIPAAWYESPSYYCWDGSRNYRALGAQVSSLFSAKYAG